MVLAASVRRGGQSLAGIARAEIGPAAGRGHGDRHPLRHHHRPGRPGDRRRQGPRRRGGADEGRHRARSIPPAPAIDKPDRPRRLDGLLTSPRLDLRVRRRGRPGDDLPRVVPARRPRRHGRRRRTPSGDGLRPARGGPAARPGQLVGRRSRSPARSRSPCSSGWYMYRFRKGKVVEASLVGRRGGPGGDGRRGVDPRARALERFFSLSRDQTILRHRRLRVRRLGPAGLAAALPARLPVELPQDRHDRAAGRRA